MIINYQADDGRFIELEVAEEIGTFYLESIAAEKKNGRQNSRPGVALSGAPHLSEG